jgi:hypothetical protein
MRDEPLTLTTSNRPFIIRFFRKRCRSNLYRFKGDASCMECLAFVERYPGQLQFSDGTRYSDSHRSCRADNCEPDDHKSSIVPINTSRDIPTPRVSSPSHRSSDLTRTVRLNSTQFTVAGFVLICDLWMIICTCYSWETALIVGLYAPFDTYRTGRGYGRKYVKLINSMKDYITSDAISVKFSTG